MRTIKGVIQLGIKTSLDNLTGGSKPGIWCDGAHGLVEEQGDHLMASKR